MYSSGLAGNTDETIWKYSIGTAPCSVKYIRAVAYHTSRGYLAGVVRFWE